MVLPSLDSLRCFEAAARAGSFRAAAKAVALTPAALGQRIRQLEEQLKTQLFIRTTRTVKLTAEGAALVPKARGALEAAAELVRSAHGVDMAPPVELTLGTRFELGLSFLVPLHARIEAAVPALTLHYYFGSGPDLLLRVRSREIDCAVTSTRLNDPKLLGLRLHEEQYVFVGATKLLDRQPLLAPAQATRHTLIDGGPDLPLFRYWRDAEGGGDRLSFDRVRYFGSGEACRQAVLSGKGVGVLPRHMVAADLSAKRLRVVLKAVTPLADHFRLIYRADDPRPFVYQALAAELLRHRLR